MSSQKQTEAKTLTKVKEEVTAVPPAPSRPNMAAILTDCDPKAIYATVHKEPKDSGSGAAPAVRTRPGDLKLARSLSKSDSDLLVSPPVEEEGGLGNRSESVSNCSSGKKRLEKSPSFTSEWDEVGFSSSVWITVGAGCRFRQVKVQSALLHPRGSAAGTRDGFRVAFMMPDRRTHRLGYRC